VLQRASLVHDGRVPVTAAVAAHPPAMRGRAGLALALAGGIGLASCAATTHAPVVPARPTLPAVKFVAPCDPQATVGLTAAGVEDLKQRDAAWRAYAERLEAALRGAK
jgi:hypothetical protein